MKFDYSYAPQWPNVSAPALAAMLATREARRAAGLAVQFLREDGALTEWQFTSVAQRDSFIARLPGAYVISGN